MNKKKSPASEVLQNLPALLLGACAGFLIMVLTNTDGSLWETILSFCISTLMVVLTHFIHIAAHEAGHMVCGLISGYEFVSYRVGSLMLIKRDGRLAFKRFQLAGTGGQCLLSPPDYNDGNFPFVLYNLGGIIANFLIAVVFLVVYLVFTPSGVFGGICICLTVFGVANVLFNGIPYKTDLVSNDGYNALHLGRDKAALRSFWVALRVNALQGNGVRLKDMDEDLFVLPEGADLGNPLTSSLLILKENRYMDMGNFNAAEEVINRVRSGDCNIHGIYEQTIKMDLLYIDVLRRGSDADLTVLDDKLTQRFMKAMNKTPYVIRTLYAVSVARGDTAKQSELLTRIEKLKSSYPYPAEIEGELELMRGLTAQV